MTDSFKNWRGMQQSGGRRIKRAIRLDSQSVRFVDDTLRSELKKIYLLKDFLLERQKIIDAYNEKHAFDMSMPVNGRRMTNLGVYRAYVESYIKHHPRIHQEMTILVRQLPTEGRGIPMEIYCFTDTTNWGEYESIQADIFDHLFAATSIFGLDIFQEPGGRDFSRALSGTRQG
jgi:miniconductance mechanosensitive channel